MKSIGDDFERSESQVASDPPLNEDWPGKLFCSRQMESLRNGGMNSSINDKIKGTAKQVAGKTKQVAGKAIGDGDLQDRGTAEKAEGKIQKKVGEVKHLFGK